MKFKELVQMSKDEQEIKQKELELELIKLNAQVATGTPPKNAGQLRRLKKDIARIMLIKGNRRINEKSSVQNKPRMQAKKQGDKAEAPQSKTAKKTSDKTK